MLLMELHDSIDSSKLESSIFLYISQSPDLLTQLVQNAFEYEDKGVFLHSLSSIIRQPVQSGDAELDSIKHRQVLTFSLFMTSFSEVRKMTSFCQKNVKNLEN